MASRDASVEKAKAKLDEWSAEIDRLQARAKEAEADAKLKYNEQLEEMRARRDAAQAQVVEMQKASDKAWDDVRNGFEKAWTDLQSAFESAMSRYK